MNPTDDAVVTGVLTGAWNGHPAGAFVVTGLTAVGWPVAVSTTAG
jgi:hypothetical protein